MYDELVKRLRASCESCKLWDGYKCCLKGECSAQTRLQAADAIEELSRDLDSMNEANIALYGALPKWIPVTERLPKEGEFVLVYGNLYPNKHDGGVIAVSKRMDWNYWQGFGRERNITHWMPLPQPPKEETE